MDDQRWMKAALRLAEKGRGRTSPNPMVGAILVKEGNRVGEGYHARAGEAHAEIIALGKAGVEARGSTLYINLEPCSHFGKTPPCVPAIIEAGVKRVVVGMVDPNPIVKGKGLEGLQNAGVEIEVGLLEIECRRLNEAFCKYILKKEPFVTLKAAATLDGKIATREGESKWITAEESRRFVHRLRDHTDGVIIGVGTVLKDDPLLTARIRGGRDPVRIILDSRLRIPEEARVIKNAPSITIVATTEWAPNEKIERLREKGLQILIFESLQGRVNLKAFLSRLGEMGMMNVLVEGGSQINSSFLKEGLADKLLLFLSPKIIGDNLALGVFGGQEAVCLKDAIKIKELRARKIAGDLLIEGYPEKQI